MIYDGLVHLTVPLKLLIYDGLVHLTVPLRLMIYDGLVHLTVPLKLLIYDGLVHLTVPLKATRGLQYKVVYHDFTVRCLAYLGVWVLGVLMPAQGV